MQKDTIKRVQDSLQATRDGKLLWLQGKSSPLPSASNAFDLCQPCERAGEVDVVEGKEGGKGGIVNFRDSIDKYTSKKEGVISFLQDGFEELLKSRQVSSTPNICQCLLY
jgi:hypothetical protein